MSAETVKTGSDYLAGTIAAELDDATSAFGRDTELLLKFHGIYQQASPPVRACSTTSCTRATCTDWSPA